MPSVFDNRLENADQTVRVFDAFYNSEIDIPSNEWDIVLAFFRSTCETEKQAENMASAIFRVTQFSGVPALDLLQIIKGKLPDKLQMNSVICYYLNSIRSKTASYGISYIPQANEPVARNIVQ